ncbi:MAG TPA: response regulator, partial [Nocardioidaceae bacterium]|nr:response regulator [Nocardioidaceae bacterium]
MARIVVADDDADIRDLIALKLRQGGHQIETVKDGAAAVEACRAHQPDLVLLDVMMPGMTGLEACRILRQDEAFVDVPILLLTARAHDADVERGFAEGADDYVVKP